MWLVERVRSTRGRSTPRSTRAFAGRSPTRRSTDSTAGFRSGSGRTRSTPTVSTRRSSTCSSAWTTRSPARFDSRLQELDLLELEGSARSRSRALRPPGRRARPAARSAAIRGRIRDRPGAHPSSSAGLDLGGFTVSREDRPDRRRSVLGPRHRPGLQVGDGALREAGSSRTAVSRSPSTCSRCATSSGSSRSAGLYRSLSGEREARGMLREGAAEDVPGLAAQDYLDEEAFWGTVDHAVDRARGAVGRMRAGDVRHDPRWTDGCPAWCRSWAMCRVERP